MSFPSRRFSLALARVGWTWALVGGCAMDGAGLVRVEAGTEDPGGLTGEILRGPGSGGGDGGTSATGTGGGEPLPDGSGQSDDGGFVTADGAPADANATPDRQFTPPPPDGAGRPDSSLPASDLALPIDLSPALDLARSPDAAPTLDAAPTGLAAGLVAHWKLDDGKGSIAAADSSENHNDGILYMLNVDSAWVTGRIAGAISIGTSGQTPGRDQGVVVPRSTSLDAVGRRFTFAGWIRKAAARSGAYRAIISRQGSGDAYLFSLGFQDGRLRVSGSKLGQARSTGDPLPTVSAWGHVAATFDGTTVRLYIDGTPAPVDADLKSNATIAPSNAENTPVVIGAERESTTDFDELMDGQIDDLRIYNRALTSDEIKRLAAP